MAKVAPINPFAAAQKKPAATSKPKTQVIVAGDVVEPDGSVRFKAADVITSIDGFADGAAKETEGKALKDTHRPVVTSFAIQEFARQWVDLKRLPENPKISTDGTGTGRLIGVSFTDKQMNLSPDEFSDLSNLLGADVAKSVVEDRQEFKLNSETLEKTVMVKDAKGKDAKQTVMDAVAEALQAKFADHPDILANLFELKPIFRTQDGLIHKGLQLVGGNMDKAAYFRLADFLRKTRTIVALKPSGGR